MSELPLPSQQKGNGVPNHEKRTGSGQQARQVDDDLVPPLTGLTKHPTFHLSPSYIYPPVRQPFQHISQETKYPSHTPPHLTGYAELPVYHSSTHPPSHSGSRSLNHPNLSTNHHASYLPRSPLPGHYPPPHASHHLSPPSNHFPSQQYPQPQSKLHSQHSHSIGPVAHNRYSPPRLPTYSPTFPLLSSHVPNQPQNHSPNHPPKLPPNQPQNHSPNHLPNHFPSHPPKYPPHHQSNHLSNLSPSHLSNHSNHPPSPPHSPQDSSHPPNLPTHTPPQPISKHLLQPFSRAYPPQPPQDPPSQQLSPPLLPPPQSLHSDTTIPVTTTTQASPTISVDASTPVSDIPTAGSGIMVILSEELLTMRQAIAARKLGISSSALSKRWRESMKGRKWPYRIHSKLEKEISSLLQQHQGPYKPPEVERKLNLLLTQRRENLELAFIRF